MEISVRGVKFLSTCLTECNYKYLKNRTIHPNKKLGIATYDEIIGYIPTPNIDLVLDKTEFPHWYGAKIIHDANGFRSNENFNIVYENNEKVFVYGSSFAYGDQVSNNETWPACLERKIKSRVHNAGVFGYGTAQSYLRYKENKKKLIKNDDLIIFSSVLGNDFYRDTMSYRSGFPRAYIRKNNDQSLSFSKPPPKDLIGSKFYKSQNSFHKYNFLYSSLEKSWFLHALGITNIEFFNKYKRMINKIEIDAAEKYEIIEYFIDEISKIERVLVVLQYSPNKIDVLNERKFITQLMNKNNINYVDTYDVIYNSGYKYSELFIPHHTPFANKLVCKAVFDKLKKI